MGVLVAFGGVYGIRAARIIPGGEMRARNAVNRFAERVEQDRLDDVRLVIYYRNPFSTSRIFITVDHLTEEWHTKKIIVEGDALREHIDTLRQVNSDILMPNRSQYGLNARIYYIFETTDGRRIFDVAMWMWDSNLNVLVNNREFEWNDVFADIIMPFIPDDGDFSLSAFIGMERS